MYKIITDGFQLHKALGESEDEHACDGPDAVHTNDLHDKTRDLVSDLKISD